MNEALLYYLWQKQAFSPRQLYTADGEALQVIHPGYRNNNAGPDFTDAWIRMEGLRWNGPIEIHVLASDWLKHGHQNNRAYQNIILHIVYQADATICYSNGSPIPTLELKNYLSPETITRYKSLVENEQEDFACSRYLGKSTRLSRFQMLDTALANRLDRKGKEFLELLKRNKNNWEESIYQQTAQSLGYKVNAEMMLNLAKGMPLSVLRRLVNNLFEKEALLLGQAGLLASDIFVPGLGLEEKEELWKTWKQIISKSGLKDAALNPVQWKNGRLYPGGFPAERIKQLALMVHNTPNFEALIPQNNLQAEAIWQNGKKKQLISPHVIINTLVPVTIACGLYRKENHWKTIALQMLENLPAENNTLTRQWNRVGLPLRNAADTQAAIEQFNGHCKTRKCLQCPIAQEWLSEGKKSMGRAVSELVG